MHDLRAFLLLILAASAAGCVERKLYIRSDPEGAVVSLNREAPLEGVTPLEVPYSFYGSYSVRLVREGYRDLEARAEVEPPWWSWPPFDLFTELLLPFTIEDHREFHYILEPLPPARSTEESREHNRRLVERGEEFRRQVKEEGAR
jgi:hypothetical protein